MGRKIIYNTYKEIIFIKTLYTRTCMTFLKIKMKKKILFSYFKTNYSCLTKIMHKRIYKYIFTFCKKKKLLHC